MTKSKNLKITLLCLALTELFIPAKSYAYVLLGAGLNIDKPTDSSSAAAYGSQGGIGFGAMIGLNLLPVIDLELGLWDLKRSFFTGNYTETSSWFQVPVLARLWIPFVGLGVGAGLYGAKATGNIHIDSPNYTSDVTFDQAQLKSTDIGFILSVIWSPPIIPLAFVEGRYTQSLTSNDTTGGSFKYTDMLVAVGLKFGMLGGGK